MTTRKPLRRTFVLVCKPRFPGERMSPEARLGRVAARYGIVLTTARRDGR